MFLIEMYKNPLNIVEAGVPIFTLQMKVLCLTSTLILVVLAQEPTDKSGSELSECGSRVTDKIQALSGKFLGKDELADVRLKNQEFNCCPV